MAQQSGDGPSPQEVYAIAFRTAAELARTYDALARAVEKDRPETGAVFAALAEKEAVRMRELEPRCGEALSAADASKPLLLLGEAEFEELAHSDLVTPFRALSAAVIHCERAFTAWVYVSAASDDAPARAAAESLAAEALSRANMLRRERRLAWRAECNRPRRRAAARAAETERLLHSELLGLAAQSSGAQREALLAMLPPSAAARTPAQDASVSRARRYAEELADIYIDAIARAENAVGAERVRRRALLSVLRLGRIRALLSAHADINP